MVFKQRLTIANSEHIPSILLDGSGRHSNPRPRDLNHVVASAFITKMHPISFDRCSCLQVRQ